MPKNTNRAVVFLLSVAVVLATNTELLALILTIHAIGVETAVLLLTLQVRSISGSFVGLATILSVAIRSVPVQPDWKAGLLLNFCPRREHPFVLSQLTLLLYLRFRAVF